MDYYKRNATYEGIQQEIANLIGTFLLQLLTKTPPDLFISSAKTSVIFLHLSAKVEKGPVSEIVVPNKIGSLHDPIFA